MSSKYFNKLNYTLANEDTSLEVNIIPENQDCVLCVCGSGARVLPLLASCPKEIVVCDISETQLFLAELRINAAKILTYEQYAGFFGYPSAKMSGDERREIFFKLDLSHNARIFLKTVFENIGWSSILYEGKWEKTFNKLSSIVRFFTGKRGLELFDCKTIEEQIEFLDTRFPRLRWYAALKLFGNASVFNTLLYKGSFPVKNIPESFYEFYKGAFDRCFKLRPARENYFLQIVFFGKLVYEEGMPLELRRDCFEKIKAALNETKILYRLGSVLDIGANLNKKIDFVSLSDVPSYFSGYLEKKFMQVIKPNLKNGALVVTRSYQHIPVGVDLTGFEDVTASYTGYIEKELTQMYLTDVYRKKG